MIAFDIDGVLYDYHSKAYAYAVQNFGLTMEFDDFWKVTTYDEPPLTDGQIVDLWTDPILYNQIGCKYAEVVHKVADAEGGVIYMTRRPESLAGLTSGWIISSGLPTGGLLCAPDLAKGAWCLAFDVSFMVEDRPDLFTHNNGRTSVIGVRKPWNEELGGRVDYWLDSLWELPRAIQYLKERQGLAR